MGLFDLCLLFCIKLQQLLLLRIVINRNILFLPYMPLSTIMNGSPATSRLLAELYGCSHLGTQASLQHVWLSCMNATEAQSCSLCKGLLACSGVLSSPAHRRVVDIEQCYATFRLAKLLFTCSFVHVRCDVSSPPVVLYPRNLGCLCGAGLHFPC